MLLDGNPVEKRKNESSLEQAGFFLEVSAAAEKFCLLFITPCLKELRTWTKNTQELER